MKFILKQYLKMFMQGFFLPIIYSIYRNKPINERLVVFADAHHSTLPFSMHRIYQMLEEKDFEIVDYIEDYKSMSVLEQMSSMISFMKLYARARFVFICDNYLPVSACNKRRGTTVVQLWHSGGIFKTFGFDTHEDIPRFYKLNPYKNYDLVTVSAKCCEAVYANAMRLPQRLVKATGVSRSDFYFDITFVEKCREQFYLQYPDAMNKKILLWAPTFRGNAGTPHIIGEQEILDLKMKLGNDWMVLIKLHPHLTSQFPALDCAFSTEQLLPVIDLLVTDYSTILFDYLLMKKPFVLWAPDYQDYSEKRGFYFNYQDLPGNIVKQGADLLPAILNAMAYQDYNALKVYADYQMGACDGSSTQRILDEIHC